VGRVEAEEALGGHVGDLPHGPELDRRPPNQLEQVESRGQERAAQPEDRTEQHHRWHALPLAGKADQRERKAADHGSDDDREEGGSKPERGDEEGAGDHHEQPDREVTPQDRQVEAGQSTTIGRHGTDAP
jgi:hypothetical protein